MHPCRAQLWRGRNNGSRQRSSVVGLVYIAAHMPDTGESESQGGVRFPSDLAKSGAIKKTSDGFTYIDPPRYHELFAADVPASEAAFMARSQVLNLGENFKAIITKAAWRTKPSWMLVSEATARSTRSWNAGMRRGRKATKSKFRVLVMWYTFLTQRK